MSYEFADRDNSYDLFETGNRRSFWVWIENIRIANLLLVLLLALALATGAIAIWQTLELKRQKKIGGDVKRDYTSLCVQHFEALEDRVSDNAFDPRVQAAIAADAKAFATQCYPEGLQSEVINKNVSLPIENLYDVTLKLVGTSNGQNYRHVNLRVEDPSTRRFVDNLKRQDFEVFLGQTRLSNIVVQNTEVTSEQRAIALLQDKSGSTEGDADRDATSALSSFIKAYAGPSKMRPWSFSDSATPLCPWTSDKELLLAACLEKKPKGGTALYDSLLEVIADLSKRTETRTLILISDGADTTKRELLQTVIDRCKASSIAVYAIGLKSSALSEPALKRLAEETGGKYLLAERSQDLLPRCKEIARSIFSPAYRLIALVPTNDDEALRIEVGKAKLIVPALRGL